MGARSANPPPSRRRPLRRRSRSAAPGSSCARCAGSTPSLASICSAFPWSAQTNADAALRLDGGDHSVRGTRRRPPRLDHGGDHPRVADHVGVGEVHDREAVVAASRSPSAKRRAPRAADISGFRSYVGDVPGRRNEDPILPRPLLLPPAVQEVRDVRVLLGLGDVQLASARAPQRPRRSSLSTSCSGNATGQSRSSR